MTAGMLHRSHFSFYSSRPVTRQKPLCCHLLCLLYLTRHNLRSESRMIHNLSIMKLPAFRLPLVRCFLMLSPADERDRAVDYPLGDSNAR